MSEITFNKRAAEALRRRADDIESGHYYNRNMVSMFGPDEDVASWSLEITLSEFHGNKVFAYGEDK